jgi:hypothetical protein
MCVPQRIGFRLPHVLSGSELDLERLAAAVLCDRAACRLGMTMETWALRAALATGVDGTPA